MKNIKNISRIVFAFVLFFYLSENKSNAQCRDDFSETKVVSFTEKPYYSKIFDDGERADLAKQKKLVKEAQNNIKEAKALRVQAQKLADEAEKTKKRIARKKLEIESKKKFSLAFETEEKAYQKLLDIRKSQYNIYLDNIEDTRYNSKIRDTREARNYESKARRQMQNAKSYMRNADNSEKNEKIKNYHIADSLQVTALRFLENAFSAYYGDSPSNQEKSLNDAEAYAKYIAKKNDEYETEIKILLKEKEPEAWMVKINSEYQKYEKCYSIIDTEKEKIKEYNKKIEALEIKAKNDKNAKREISRIKASVKRSNTNISSQKKYAKRYENNIIEELRIKINDDKLKNQEKFESYNDGFAYYDRTRENKIIDRAEDEILEDLKTAKDYIYKAEFANQCAKARLKIYLYLLRANYHQAQAMEKLVEIRKKNPSLFRATKIKLANDCSANQEKTSKKTNKKNTAKKDNNKTNKTTKHKQNTSYSNSNKWKYPNKKGIRYKVQILAQTNIPPTSAFKGLSPISSEIIDQSSLTAYLVGSTTSMFYAESLLKKAKAKGFKDAYIVAYYKGERIPLWEAEDIINGLKKTNQKNKKDSNAKNKNTSESRVNSISLSKTPGIIFTVQVAYSKNKPTKRELKNLQPVYEYRLANGYAKYSIGRFRDFYSADKECSKIKKIGIKDAFVTAYENGKPINLQKAIKKQR